MQVLTMRASLYTSSSSVAGGRYHLTSFSPNRRDSVEPHLTNAFDHELFEMALRSMGSKNESCHHALAYQWCEHWWARKSLWQCWWNNAMEQVDLLPWIPRLHMQVLFRFGPRSFLPAPNSQHITNVCCVFVCVFWWVGEGGEEGKRRGSFFF